MSTLYLVLGVTVYAKEGDTLYYSKMEEVKEGEDIKAFINPEKYSHEKIDCAFIYLSEEEAQKRVDEWNDYLMRCGISAL